MKGGPSSRLWLEASCLGWCLGGWIMGFMMKRFLVMLAVVAAGLLIGSAALMKYGLQRAGEGQTVMDNPPAGVDSPPSLVNWVQTPTTVAALYETADLVVRGRIITQTEWYSSQT